MRPYDRNQCSFCGRDFKKLCENDLCVDVRMSYERVDLRDEVMSLTLNRFIEQAERQFAEVSR